MPSQLPPLPPPKLGLPEPRRSPVAGWLSLVVHLVLVLVLIQVTRDGLWWQPPPLDPGPAAAEGGGGGSREVTLIALPAPALPEVSRVRIVPPVDVPVVTPEKIAPPVPAPPPDTIPRPATADSSGGGGGGSGGGTGTGTGPGTGPGSGGGGGGPGAAGTGDSSHRAGRPPEPRQLILPPFDYPAVMRGRTIAVTFFVLADGRVDRVVFSEEIPDRGYARKLENTLRAYRFRPARSPEGLPVPGVTTVSISF